MKICMSPLLSVIMTVCPDISASWNTGLYVNLLTSSVSFSFLRPSTPAPPPPAPPPSVPQCVWLVAQTLSIRIALQYSSEEGKKEHISAISAERCSFLYTQRNDSPAWSNSRGNTTVTIELLATCYFREVGRFLRLLIHWALIFHT